MIAPLPSYCILVTFCKFITSVLEEKAVLSAIGYSDFCCLLSSCFLGAWEVLRYFIVAFPGPSVNFLLFLKPRSDHIVDI